MTKIPWILLLSALLAAMISGAADVLILTPVPGTDTGNLERLLAAAQLSSEAVMPEELAAKLTPSTRVVFGWNAANYGREVRAALDGFQSRGGMLVFQGIPAGREALSMETRQWLRERFGVAYGEYAADPELGTGVIQHYMFIRPEGAEFWGAEHPELWAVYAGEAFTLEPAGAGVTAGSWVMRDRMTKQGPAVVAQPEHDGAGATVFFGTYPLVLADDRDRGDLPAFHAWLMVRQLLEQLAQVSFGESAATPAPAEPLNLHAVTPAVVTPRSMWLWEIDEALVPEKRAMLLDFAVGRHIDCIYAYTGGLKAPLAENAALREFIAAAHARGIRVEGLDGWAEAVLPEEQSKFLASLGRVLDYNAAVAPDERFSGFQSDVEPITMEAYHASPEARRRFDRAYVELHARCAAAIDAAGAADFDLGMAVQEGLDREAGLPERAVEWNGREASVLEHLLTFVDYLAIMSYHDRAPVIRDAVAGELVYGARAGVPIFVGVETLDVMALFGGSRSLSFYEEGLEEMELELEKLVRSIGDESAFAGIAIHHYDSYRRLPDGPRRIAVAAGQPLTAAKGALGPAYAAAERDMVAYGRDAWRDAADLSAVFRFGWEPTALTVAVEVRDDVIFSGYAGPDLWKSDHLELWVRIPGRPERFQIGVGTEPGAPGNVYVWHPQSLNEAERAALATKIGVECEKTPDGYRLRCRIPAEVFGLAGFAAGQTLEAVAEIGDTDVADQPAKLLMSLAPARDREDPATYSPLLLDDR